MKYLSALTKIELTGKAVILRIDCDVDLRINKDSLVVDEDYRLKCVIPTINYLLNHHVQKIIMIGHVGRPEGKTVEELKLEPVARWFMEQLNSSKFKVQSSKLKCKVQNFYGYEITEKIILLENIRFDKREEENDEGYVKELTELGDVYVNEAFGVSHRNHASIVGVPKYLPAYYGLRFEKEIERLTWLKNDALRPLVFVLGGSKKDKLEYLGFLRKWADTVLIGGKIPLLIQNANIKMQNLNQNAKTGTKDFVPSIPVSQYPSIKLAVLTPSGLDISRESIEQFKQLIFTAKTVVWAGPMGKYEEEGNKAGTYEIAQAVANCTGVKFAGGGDTHRIISRLNLWDKFDFVSVGGGAMLKYLMGAITYS